MSEQDKVRLFRDIQAALAVLKGIHVSQEALTTFFEHAESDDDGSGSYTLLMSYREAKENPDFSQITQAQESIILDFPGVVFSFTEETYCLDCGSDERAHETDVWDWFTHVSTDIEKALKGSIPFGLNLISKWNEITDREDRSIKEAMNFLYHNLIQGLSTQCIQATPWRSLHPPWLSAVQLGGGDQAVLSTQIERIETALRLKEELHNNKTTTRTKI